MRYAYGMCRQGQGTGAEPRRHIDWKHNGEMNKAQSAQDAPRGGGGALDGRAHGLTAALAAEKGARTPARPRAKARGAAKHAHHERVAGWQSGGRSARWLHTRAQDRGGVGAKEKTTNMAEARAKTGHGPLHLM